MTSLPYVDVDRELHYNLGVAMVLLRVLSVTKSGKKVLNLDKFQLFFSLSVAPKMLDKVLQYWGRPGLDMEQIEYYVVSNSSSSYKDFFDTQRAKLLLRTLVFRKLVSISYRPADGFLFELSKSGIEITDELMKENYLTTQKYVRRMEVLKSKSTSKIRASVLCQMEEKYYE